MDVSMGFDCIQNDMSFFFVSVRREEGRREWRLERGGRIAVEASVVS